MVSFKHTAVILGLFSVAGCSMFGSSPTPAPAPVVSQITPASAAMRDSTMSPDQIKAVQTRLASEGLYSGKIDGAWGPATESAVNHYQSNHSLTVTGKLDTETTDAMNAKNAQNQPTNEVH